jgi:hypothetical protein
LSNSAFVTTLTLENAMAAPANIGFNSPSAASGIPIKL